MSTRRALVIGCTAADYPGVETSARAFAAVLRARHRFTAIECLTAAKATAANIHSAFAALTAATGPGDVVVIYYAGHASHFRLDVPEGAGQLRITLIAPAGVEQSTPDDFRGLLGADFSALIQGVLCQTDNVTVILDCCDGENMVDLVTVDRAPELRRAFEGKLRRIAAERFADHGEHHETPCVRPRGPGFVLVSASAAGGIAFVHPRGGRLLFTSLLCQALAKPNAVQRSWQELLAMVHGELDAGQPTLCRMHSGSVLPADKAQAVARLQAQGRTEEEAALVLGASGWQTFWYVTLPDRKSVV